MMNLPDGYRWANEYETESRWHESEMILVHDTEAPEHADVALPCTVPVVVDTSSIDPTQPYLCTEEFGEHDEHDEGCMDSYVLLTTDYFDPYWQDEYDMEYQNCMYGSSRY